MEKIMKDILPTEFQLKQNYPNPFKERTTIKFCVPDKARIKVEVFDSSRNKVKTLIRAIKEAGTYKVEFSAIGGSLLTDRPGTPGGDAWTLPSGVYFYRLQAGDFIETKKMLLMK